MKQRIKKTMSSEQFQASEIQLDFYKYLLDLGLPVHSEYQFSRVRIDIAIPEVRLAIEVDGPHHMKPEVKEQDKARDYFLRSEGWKVERIPTKTINKNIVKAKDIVVSGFLQRGGILNSTTTELIKQAEEKAKREVEEQKKRDANIRYRKGEIERLEIIFNSILSVNPDFKKFIQKNELTYILSSFSAKELGGFVKKDILRQIKIVHKERKDVLETKNALKYIFLTIENIIQGNSNYAQILKKDYCFNKITQNKPLSFLKKINKQEISSRIEDFYASKKKQLDKLTKDQAVAKAKKEKKERERKAARKRERELKKRHLITYTCIGLLGLLVIIVLFNGNNSTPLLESENTAHSIDAVSGDELIVKETQDSEDEIIEEEIISDEDLSYYWGIPTKTDFVWEDFELVTCNKDIWDVFELFGYYEIAEGLYNPEDLQEQLAREGPFSIRYSLPSQTYGSWLSITFYDKSKDFKVASVYLQPFDNKYSPTIVLQCDA